MRIWLARWMRGHPDAPGRHDPRRKPSRPVPVSRCGLVHRRVFVSLRVEESFGDERQWVHQYLDDERPISANDTATAFDDDARPRGGRQLRHR